MKSLSLARPLVIMVIGIPGSGKSFFARQFAEMFGAPLVSHDFVRHAISPSATFVPEEDALVAALTQNELNELLKTQRTVIVDGGMNNRVSRQATEQAAKKNGYGTLTIWVQTDLPTSKARSMRRSAQKATDMLNSSMDESAFERYTKQLTPPRPGENTVVISGKHTYATQARVVLKKLVVPRDTQLKSARPHTNHDGHNDDIQPRRHHVTIN